MAAHWWWTWSIGLNSTEYSTAGFTLSSTTNILTNNNTSLFTPVTGSPSPDEEFHLRISGTNSLITPVFTNGPISQGWIVFRYANLNQVILSPLARIVEFLDPISNVIFDLRFQTTGNGSVINLYVDNSLHGSSSISIYQGRYYVFALDFDLTQSTPQVGLVINGVRQISRSTPGSGGTDEIDKIKFSSGGLGGSASFGDVIVFNDLNDLTDKSSQDVWVTFLDPNFSNDPDNSWTPSAGSDLTAVNDANASTYTESATSPDSIFYQFESCNDRHPSWDPSLIYGTAFLILASANVSQTNTSLELEDAASTYVMTTNTILNSTATFFGMWLPVDGNDDPWTKTNLEGLSLEYVVS